MHENERITFDEILAPLGEIAPELINNDGSKLEDQISKISPDAIEEIKRKAARNLIRKDLNKWIPLIKEKIEKKTLIVGKEEGEELNNILTDLSETECKLEELTRNILKKVEKENVEVEAIQNKQIEKEFLKKGLIEERKIRAYMSNRHSKYKIAKKIKSKKYRLLKRKEKLELNSKNYQERYKLEIAKLANSFSHEKINIKNPIEEDNNDIIKKENEINKNMDLIYSLPFMQKSRQKLQDEELDNIKNEKKEEDIIEIETDISRRKIKYNEMIPKSKIKEELEMKVNLEKDIIFKRDLIEKVFDGEDLVHDFVEEKEKVLEDIPNEVEEPLLGWAGWAGAGISNPIAFNKKKTKNLENRLKKINKGLPWNVILREEPLEHRSKYILESIPYPFESLDQYEEYLKPNIGKEWSSIHGYQKIIKPKIQTEPGKVLIP